MQNTRFTPEKLLAQLKAEYVHLNDNDAKAQEVYEYILSKQTK